MMTLRWPVALMVLFLLQTGSKPGIHRLPRVLNGIDVLREQNFKPLEGKRVGLVTNHTGLSADGTSTIDLLFQSKVCKLVALFSPEHGIRGIVDEKVSSSLDESTGLPVHSLYGDTRRPTPDMLKNLDALVFDIQDIGARFYTYCTTMAYCMEEAAKANLPFYVLDRPNPISGVLVEGPMLDADKISFNGYLPLPVRHGMTIGELARYFNAEKGIGAQLHVIPMNGWNRSMYFWDTGQVWVDPSPNIRNIMAAILYPGVCLLERTNVSVGRGTDRPFEIVGAPWIDPRQFAASLQAMQMPGIRFIPTFFIPGAGKNQNLKCGGVSLLVTDIEQLKSVQIGLALITVLNKSYPEEFQIDNVIDLLGNEDAIRRIKAGQSPEKVVRTGNPDIQKFLVKRRKALIYDPIPKPEEGRQ